MKIIIFSCSLKPASRSRIMAREAFSYLNGKTDQPVTLGGVGGKEEPLEVEFVDLQDYPMPFCDAGASYGDEQVKTVSAKTEEADGFLLATPVYNFDANAAAKNLIELTGRNWENKVAGFICAAGGAGSYMSIMSLTSSLMLDFRVTIIPRFVYATGESFQGDQLAEPGVKERIHQLADRLVLVTSRLKDAE